MRLSPKPRRIVVGLLSFSAQASAVALSDFTPKATNLPAQCNTVYSEAIPGCTFDDFQKAVCSKACLAGLVEVNALVANNCQAADVAETSIVGLFKLGKAIQVLCNVAVVTTTTGLGVSTTIPLMPMPMPTTQSILSTQTTLLSTTLATTTSASSSSDTTSAPPPPSQPAPSTKQSTTLATTQPASTPPTSSIISTPPPPTAAATSQAKSTSASKTSTSPAEAESIRSGNTNSGGGSPFDNINNSGAASTQNFAQLGCGLFASIVLGGYLALA
ncbi:hypothetical protein E6O75_ATG06572 [Venturia nashicola]|uniref:Extracellular membrane protein CFEM domain-containing protein n=1 Tax=Venturia nashicola TaxID=86259 RepID=A0A4Z1PAI7_9PEZI|nr:hypothetical protein E6O75_ATG06572 [Venturia nashicola]